MKTLNRPNMSFDVTKLFLFSYN